MKILTVLGARPQFIKAASLSREIKKYNSINEVIVHTGQHYDDNMSDIFFKELNIPFPNYNLGVNGGSHAEMTGKMMIELEKIVLKENPDYILVYGDTNSTLAGALVSKKIHVKLVHVEAGLRSYNNAMPEEINRILTDRISDILFCPTQNAVDNLISEGFLKFQSRIILNGDVMKDVAMYYSNVPDFDSNFSKMKEKYILATIHRAENTDSYEKLNSIIQSLNEINNTINVIVPLHPRTKLHIEKFNISTNFKIIEPVGYLEMLSLISNCELVITDSGGLQKEAFFLKKYCITIREETEWVELVEEGYNELVGSDEEKILSAFNNFSSNQMIPNSCLYGDGNASEIICKTLIEDFKN